MDDMTEQGMGVAEAKRRFSELLTRVGKGERILVHRHGRPVAALVPPGEANLQPRPAPLGLAAALGALADWDDIDVAVAEIYAARDVATDRPVPPLPEQ